MGARQATVQWVTVRYDLASEQQQLCTGVVLMEIMVKF